jgi:UDPglucose 6-dehydrogenase
MAKHASNAFLATSISFANEIADLCETAGADAADVVEIMRLDGRIGRGAYLYPGLGFAGATLARDVRALERLAESSGAEAPLADAVLAINASRPARVRARLERELGGLEGRRVALLGLTYKPGTSTLRRAVSLQIAGDLADAGATVAGFDPLADLDEVPASIPLEIRDDVYGAAAGCDALVLVTEWGGIDELDLSKLRAATAGDVLLDTWGRIDAGAAKAAGFRYLRMGA